MFCHINYLKPKIHKVTPIRIELELGQIHINSIVKQSNDTLFLFLLNPEYLGLGGARLNWSNFSNEKGIAILTNITTDTLKFEWYVFFDKNKRKESFQSVLSQAKIKIGYIYQEN